MRILVTGRDGQVARSLAESDCDHELIFAARPDFDLADAASIESTLERDRPDLVISAAAYTAVDQAEDEPDMAMLVNGEAPGVIGRAAANIGAPVLHLSTDYVFDGSGTEPWRESDPTAPHSVYGKSKLAGEQALAASGATHAILRTAWIYSPFGTNFVKTMLALARDRDTVEVVDDQYGNPTSALDIAHALIRVADRWQSCPSLGANRVYHFAGDTSMSWAEFAQTIFAISKRQGCAHCSVEGIPASQYPAKAPRPANSRLESALFAETFGHPLPDWHASLTETIRRLIAA